MVTHWVVEDGDNPTALTQPAIGDEDTPGRLGIVSHHITRAQTRVARMLCGHSLYPEVYGGIIKDSHVK